MKKFTILTLLLAAAALCAQAQTVVTGTITVPTGDRVSGSCSFQAIGSFTSGTYRVVGAPVTVKFVAGELSVTLDPTDVATPNGQYYKAFCTVPAQTVSGRTIGPY